LEKTAEALNDQGKPMRGSRVCILGVAYKRDVDDPRESPAFELMDLLGERGALLSYSDPYIPKLSKMRGHDVPNLASQPLTAEFLAGQDCVVIVTDHTAVDYRLVVEHAPLVIDTRNATRTVREGRSNVRLA
jgi:UDP-N-acetyl-D-glucosamine dehydrogenase